MAIQIIKGIIGRSFIVGILFWIFMVTIHAPSPSINALYRFTAVVPYDWLVVVGSIFDILLYGFAIMIFQKLYAYFTWGYNGAGTLGVVICFIFFLIVCGLIWYLIYLVGG